jgi:hypothetical protein
MERWLERGERYVPMIRQRLNDAMLPEELCWLPLIESGFSNGALSSAGAPESARNPPEASSLAFRTAAVVRSITFDRSN